MSLPENPCYLPLIYHRENRHSTYRAIKRSIMLAFWLHLRIILWWDRCKRGAGYFLPGDWGCLPDKEVPQDWGIRGLLETISAISMVNAPWIYPGSILLGTITWQIACNRTTWLHRRATCRLWQSVTYHPPYHDRRPDIRNKHGYSCQKLPNIDLHKPFNGCNHKGLLRTRRRILPAGGLGVSPS